MRQVAIFAAYFGQYTKARLAYRGDFILQQLGGLAGTLIGLAIPVLLFYGAKIEAMGGWTREQVFFIYGFTYIPFGLFNVLSINLYQFSQKYIIEGRFDRILLRPVGTLPQVLFESFRLESLNEVLIGFLIVTLAARGMGEPLGALDYLVLAGMGVAGFGVLLGVFLAFVSISFFYEDKLGVAAPVYNLIMLGRYPLDIYGGALQFVLKFVIPFAFIGYYPTAMFVAGERFVGSMALAFYLTPVVGVACMLVASLIWSAGVRRYTSTGN